MSNQEQKSMEDLGGMLDIVKLSGGFTTIRPLFFLVCTICLSRYPCDAKGPGQARDGGSERRRQGRRDAG
jgi:hypothetical protein